MRLHIGTAALLLIISRSSPGAQAQGEGQGKDNLQSESPSPTSPVAAFPSAAAAGVNATAAANSTTSSSTFPTLAPITGASTNSTALGNANATSASASDPSSLSSSPSPSTNVTFDPLDYVEGELDSISSNSTDTTPTPSPIIADCTSIGVDPFSPSGSGNGVCCPGLESCLADHFGVNEWHYRCYKCCSKPHDEPCQSNTPTVVPNDTYDGDRDEATALEIKGNKFFNIQTGKSVTFRGVAYYPRPNAGELDKNNVDFFTNEHYSIWTRDIEHFVDLNINAVRLYAVDPSKNHDAFMNALKRRGIYVIVGLAANCEDCAITKDSPPSCYPPALKRRGQLIINAFAKYENVLGFSAGNEVGLSSAAYGGTLSNAPCQKKFIRDMRAYIGSCVAGNRMRSIPVGLAVADADRRENLKYYNCDTSDGTDEFEHAEWYGQNSYLHCDGSIASWDEAIGIKNVQKDFRSYSIPVLMTEFGCLNPSFPTVDEYQGTRTWLQAKWLQEGGTDSFSGGFAFEYSVEQRNALSDYPHQAYDPGAYGVGYLSPEDCDDVTVPCEFVPMPTYFKLQKVYGKMASAEVSEDKASFEVPSFRQGRTDCPTNEPQLAKISDYEWEADLISDDSMCDYINFSVSGGSDDAPPLPKQNTNDVSMDESGAAHTLTLPLTSITLVMLLHVVVGIALFDF